MRARGYAPLDASPTNTALLDQIAAHAAATGPGHVAVFDLDGCLFDTRPRQVKIFRELASREGLLPLYRVREEHFTDWSIRTTLRNAGIDDAWADAHVEQVRQWWASRFFTSAYVEYDHAMPGAVQLVRAVYEAGLKVVYLTGRDVTMRSGTEASLHAFGFPFGIDRTELFVKPDFHMDDTEFKNEALHHIETLGEVTLYMDNEPANVNMYRERHPKALVVFVETDHSPRPDTPHAAIPWLRCFYRGA